MTLTGGTMNLELWDSYVGAKSGDVWGKGHCSFFSDTP